MTERERNGIPWAHELALRLGILAALAALVLLCCVGCVTPTPDRGDALERRDIVSTAVAATLTGVAVTAPHPTFTATPVPTATVVPAATAVPTLSPLRWAEETGPPLDIIEDVSLTIANLFESPMFDDATWNALLAAQVVKIREADAALRGIVPPEECREAHAMLVSSTGDQLLAAEYMVAGFQQRDSDLLAQSVEYTRSATAKMNLYILMLEAMTEGIQEGREDR